MELGNKATYSGWTVEQQLEKARYDAMPHTSEVMHYLSNVTSDIRHMLPSLLASSVAWADMEHEMVGLVREIRVLISRPVLGMAVGRDFNEAAEGVPQQEVVDDNKDEDDDVSDYLLPQPPQATLGRRPNPRIPLAPDGSPLSQFLDECCTLDPESKTLTSLVRARHRLWRQSNSRAHTSELCTFFDNHFQNVKETDLEHLMTSSYYKGVTLKPWVPPVPVAGVFQADVDAFIRETCEVHVMGRVRTDDLLSAFCAWKGTEEEISYAERQRVVNHMQASFFRSMVPVNKGAECGPGFFGIYLATATAECREVGYNRSPNTRSSVLKMDSRGTVVAVIDSLQEFARSVVGKSSAYVCTQLTKRFADNMSGLVHTDGFLYMRSPDYLTKQASMRLSSSHPM